MPKIRTWKELWLVLYGIGLILIPPIHYHDRLIFAAEWLLIPLICNVFWLGLKKRLDSPPKELLWLWVITILVYFLGSIRGEMASRISIYKLGAFQNFSFKDDGIVFGRTMLLISMPWLLNNFLERERSGTLKLFMKVIKISILISSILAILDYQPIRIINLENLGFYNDFLFWAHRAHGTFLSPIEASFMYGFMVVYLLTGPEPLQKNPLNILTLLLSFSAGILTHGGTAIVGIIFCTLSYLALDNSRRKKLYVASSLMIIAGAMASIVLPHNFILQKTGDFVYRQATYWNYLRVARGHLWITLTGIGFSRLCADNNFILLFIQGGLLFLLAMLNWVWWLFKRTDSALRMSLVFWFITWLSFDSLGYWGIGRVCWVVLGLATFNLTGRAKIKVSGKK